MEDDHNHRQTQILKALEALKVASKDIESNSDDSIDCDSPSMKALLELDIAAADLLSGDPKLTTLSSLLSRLKLLASTLRSKAQNNHGFRSFLSRRSSGSKEISRVAGSIGSEIQSWIDRQFIHRLISDSSSDEERSNLLATLEARLAEGFNRDFQDLMLRSGVFGAVESLLAYAASSKHVRDRSAMAILAFVRFNKDVFVGEVLMGPTAKLLISIASPTSLRVLKSLISSIRSPLIDELHAAGEIIKIINLLTLISHGIEIRVLAFDTILEIGYYGRKDAIDAMMEQGIIKKLVQLQRLELGGALIEAEVEDEERESLVMFWGVERETRREKERRFFKQHPFASCVSRFSIQLEVGEGLRKREKRAAKLEVIKRVRETVSSDAEAANIVAEVLWGSTAW